MDFFKNKLVITLLTITLGIFLAMAIVNNDKAKTPLLENVVGSIISPVQNLLSTIGGGFSGFFEYFSDKKKMIAENESLKQQVIKNQKMNDDFISVKNENDRLRKLLDLKNRDAHMDLVASEIIATASGNWEDIFTIDKGTNSGIGKNEAVISDSGVIGYVEDVGVNWAKVVSIIDSDSSIGSVVVRTGDIAIVEGDAVLKNNGLCKMTYIPKNTAITVGDSIETSGLGGIYPKGILIGKVKEITADIQGISQYAVVQPAVDFEKIKEVFVVTKVNND